jgi:hypothetical protein
MVYASFLDSMLGGFLLLATYYMAHRFWKYRALERARAWAAEHDLEIAPSAVTRFNMHGQRPRIEFEAKDQDGRTYVYVLQLKAKFLFGDPLSMSARVEVLEKAEVAASAA